ncbi:glutathionylspermidine synthase family protein [Asticcacaulis sp. AND118]|uniref:glutathionylspermidine synthase family protein n=1 Tax=Asticcacaulis sp. AND118 TaxID=2840468 RepID=UPI001CFF8752|nr:glutathionylspermidine synthase family protein [Asticcacaulis sp. AND118]UDF05279.1 glutathionylspermidine synthase family protein [Asticcacaulis sp. AND118]
MERCLVPSRPNWQARVEAEGMLWHTAGDVPYWSEGVVYRFTEAEIEAIHDATEACHQMALAAVGAIIAGGELPSYGYDAEAIRLIEHSWLTNERDIYGRIDFAYDGSGAPKMLEYNADTPTSLLEGAVVQWTWLTDTAGPGATNQYNDMHRALVERMRALKAERDAGLLGVRQRQAVLHVSCVFPHDEDTGTVAYIESVAREAGLEVSFVPIDQIGFSEAEGGTFVDQDDVPIRLLFKLYPWDWLLADDYGPRLVDAVLKNNIRLFEPAWKMLLANKLLMVKMRELYPDSPYLLDTRRGEEAFRAAGQAFVRKPALGREGQNVSVFRVGDASAAEQTEGNYGDNVFVYQAFASLFHDDDSGTYALIGSWVIGGEAQGMGIRESDHAITDDRSRFVPHQFA